MKLFNNLKYTILFLFSLTLLLACQSLPPRAITEQELVDRYQDFLRLYESDLDHYSHKTLMRLKHEYQRALLSSNNESQSYDMLMLSGGGPLGAFGTGFLKGWGQVKEDNYARPQFDYVSGISTGALIAPFAFIGTSEAYDEIIKLYQGLGPDSARKRGLLSYLPSSDSFYDVSILREQINSAISPDLIGKIAGGAIQGRQLLIGATNMDYAMLRVWDLAQIASEMSTEKSIERTVSILSASTALPVMFPPVIIDNHLYADGGVVMQIVNGIHERNWAYQAIDQSTKFVENGTPIKIRVWIIVNDKMLLDPAVVPLKWPSILKRMLNTSIRSSALQNIQDAETLIQLINDRPKFDVQLRYVAIPQSFPIQDTEEIFNPETIQNLIELGLKMGADPTSWKTDALRPGAPFVSKNVSKNRDIVKLE